MGISLNNLSGSIPVQVLGLSSLSKDLDLSRIKLIGTILVGAGKIGKSWVPRSFQQYVIYQDQSLIHLVCARVWITSCTWITIINLEGTIPQSLNPLRGTEELDISTIQVQFVSLGTLGFVEAYLSTEVG